jgi:hypothetical protein
MREKIELEGYVVNIIDEPLEELSKDEQTRFGEGCVPVARKGFGNDGITLSDILLHALDVNTGIYIEDDKGEIVGFGGSVPEEIYNRTVLHLKGTAIHPDHQSKKLYNIITPVRVLRDVEKLGSNVFIGSRTQSPVVFTYMSQKLGFFPQVDAKTPETIQLMSEGYAQRAREKHSDFNTSFRFEINGGIVKKVYANSLATIKNLPADFNLEDASSTLRDGITKQKGYERYENKVKLKGFNLKDIQTILNDIPVSIHATLKYQEQGFSMYGPTLPKSRDPKVNKFIADNFDVQNGDGIVLLGQFDKSTYLNALKGLTKTIDPQGKLYERFNIQNTIDLIYKKIK